MANLKEVIITLPSNAIKEIDFYAEEDNKTRNEFISQIIKNYLTTIKFEKSEEKMKYGYLEMAGLNLCLASEGFWSENETFFYYEMRLADCE